MGSMGVAVPSLCILAGLIGLQAMYIDMVPQPQLASGFLWLLINLIMTVQGGGPSLQGTILLAGTLVGLSKGLCKLDGVEHPSCASATALPPFTQPALVLCACCIICYRTRGALWAKLFTTSAACGVALALGVPAKVGASPDVFKLAANVCVLLCGTVLLMPAPPAPKAKAS